MNSSGTILAIKYGICWNHICLVREDSGGITKDNRQFINGVFWILRTEHRGGKWLTVYQRFRRWRDKKIWGKLLEILVDEPDFDG